MGRRLDFIYMQNSAQADHFLFKYTTIFRILQERRIQKLKTQAQISRLCIFNNTPEHELGSPKLYENELIDPPNNSNFDIIQVYTGF